MDKLAKTYFKMDPNSTGYITNELWASVVDDMRNECSDMHDVLMGIKVEGKCFS